MRMVMTTDLVSKPELIADYEAQHRAIWPEVAASLRAIGIKELKIYRLETRLVMVMEVPEGFDKEKDFARHMASHPRCRSWEELMSGYQLAPPGAAQGQKWGEMAEIFELP